jgi:hypothetical protein
VCAIQISSCFSRCLRVPIAMRRFYEQSLWIPQKFLLTNLNLHHGLLITDIPRLPKPIIRSARSGAAEINFFGFSNPFPILPGTKAYEPGRGGF